jgi:predicted permease
MRLHAILLLLYPASFRAEYAAELHHVFAERRRLAGGLAVPLVWLREIFDILTNAIRAHWDILRQDLHFTGRTLARSPGFTLMAVLITGLGIGANTAAFSLTDHVLLRPLPFARPAELVQLWQRTPAYPQLELSPPNFVDWRKASTLFEAMAAYSSSAVTFLGKGEPQRLEGTAVTPEFFQILRVRPLLGRVFTADDMKESSPPVVILAYAFWQSAFGGAPDVLGKTVRFDDDMFTIIGVMPADFFYPSRGKHYWFPLAMTDASSFTRDNYFLYSIARLKPGITIDEARAEMNVIAGALAQQYPRENAKLGALVEPLNDFVPSQTRMLLWALFGASACVLLIACANLANLLVARALSRRKELTVRAAMGAGRERLVRQLLTESVVLSLAGGAVGVIIALVGLPLLTQLVPARLPLPDVTVLDARVFVFAAALTLATGMGFGVLPALHICGSVDHQGLRDSARTTLGARREKLRCLLVVAEITASIVLLVCAGLLLRALNRVQTTDPGFTADSVLTLQAWLPLPRSGSTATRNAFYNDVLAGVRALPGVSSAGLITFLPMTGGGGIWPVAVPGDTSEPQTVGMRVVSPGYFATIRTPLLAGRDISDSDTLESMPVVVVSESFARRYWPGQNAVGRTFHFPLGGFPFAELDRTIVGVVRDVRFRGLERQSEPQVYLAYKQLPDQTMFYYAPKELVVRSSLDSAALLPSIRAIIQKADPELPIAAARTLQDVIDLQTAPRAAQTRLVAAFAVLSLLLAGLGIHGLLSFAVGQRKPEFGLRMALGARPRDIIAIVLREGFLLSAIGTVAGVSIASLAGYFMRGLLAGVAAVDPLTLAVAVVVALGMTLSGSILPVLLATRTDPARVIRGD